MESKNTSEKEEGEFKFQVDLENTQEMEEKERDIQGTSREIIVEGRDRINLRDRSNLKPPTRLEVNVTEHIPKIFKKAISGTDAEKWSQAIAEELEAHRKNETWILVPRRNIKTKYQLQMVFKILYDAAGNICRYKARLCARGFH